MTLEPFKRAYPEYASYPDDQLLAAMRQKYPAYQSWDDSTLATSLNEKFGKSAPAAPSAPRASTLQSGSPFDFTGAPSLQENFEGIQQDAAPSIDLASQRTAGYETGDETPELNISRMREESRRSNIPSEFGDPGKREFDPLMGLKSVVYGWAPWAAASFEGLEASPVFGRGPMGDIWGGIADRIEQVASGHGYAEVQDAAGGKIAPTDISDLGETWNAIMANVGLNAPNMIVGMGAKALGSIVGGAVGSVVPGAGTAAGAAIGGAAAGMAAMSLPEAGNFLHTAKSLGVSREDASGFAATYGAVAGVIEYYQQLLMFKSGFSGALKNATKAERDAFIRKMIMEEAKAGSKNVVVKLLKDMLGEGFEEFLQEGAQVFFTNQMIKKLWAEKPDRYNPENLPLQNYDSMARAAALGAIVGGVTIGAGKTLEQGLKIAHDFKGEKKKMEARVEEIREAGRQRGAEGLGDLPVMPSDIAQANAEFNEHVANEWDRRAAAQKKWDDINKRVKQGIREQDPLHQKVEDELFLEDWSSALNEDEQRNQQEARARGISQKAYEGGLTAGVLDQLMAKIVSGQGEIQSKDYDLLEKHRSVVVNELAKALGSEEEANKAINGFVKKAGDLFPRAAEEAGRQDWHEDLKTIEEARKLGISMDALRGGLTPQVLDDLVRRALNDKFLPGDFKIIQQNSEVFKKRLAEALKKGDKILRPPGPKEKPIKPLPLEEIMNQKPPGKDDDDDDSDGGAGGLLEGPTEPTPPSEPPAAPEAPPAAPPAPETPPPVGGGTVPPEGPATTQPPEPPKQHAAPSFEEQQAKRLEELTAEIEMPREEWIEKNYDPSQPGSPEAQYQMGMESAKAHHEFLRGEIERREAEKAPPAPEVPPVEIKHRGDISDLPADIQAGLGDLPVSYDGHGYDIDDDGGMYDFSIHGGPADRQTITIPKKNLNLQTLRDRISQEVAKYQAAREGRPGRRRARPKRPIQRMSRFPAGSIGSYLADSGIDWDSVVKLGMQGEMEDMPRELFTNYPYKDGSGKDRIYRKGQKGISLSRAAEQMNERGILSAADTRELVSRLYDMMEEPGEDIEPGKTREERDYEELDRRVKAGELKKVKGRDLEVGDRFVEENPFSGVTEWDVVASSDEGVTVRPTDKPMGHSILVHPDDELYLREHGRQPSLQDRQEMLDRVIEQTGKETTSDFLNESRSLLGNTEIEVTLKSGLKETLDHDTLLDIHHLHEGFADAVQSYAFTGKAVEEGSEYNPSKAFMQEIGFPGAESAIGKLRSKPRPQYDIEGLPRPQMPTTGLKPKRGKDIGTSGLEMFEGPERRRAEEQQGDLFESKISRQDFLDSLREDWRKKNAQSFKFDPRGNEPGPESEQERAPGPRRKPPIPGASNLDPIPGPELRDLVPGRDRRAGPEPGVPARGNTGRAVDRLVTARPEFTRPADRSGVAADISRHLMDHQVEAYAKAVNSMESVGGFLLSDSTGVGKTRSLLAVAEHYRRLGYAVIVVSKKSAIGADWATGQMYGSYANDSRAMGITMKLSRDPRDFKPGTISVTTYENVAEVDKAAGARTVVIYDESQDLKNAYSGRGAMGRLAAHKSAKVMFASASAGDKIHHISYLHKIGLLEGKSIEEQYTALGLIAKGHTDKTGKTHRVWAVNPIIGKSEVARRVTALFDRLTQKGAVLKREITMDGIQVEFKTVDISEDVRRKIALIKKTYEEAYPYGMPGLLKNVMKMRIRAELENDKIRPTIELTKKELAEGRQVVIYGHRINDSELKVRKEKTGLVTEGAIRALRLAMIEAGIPESQIAEVHGESGKNNSDEIARFQAGEAKVIIATIESGGVGVNLDDVNGTVPRSMILMTMPFNGVSYMQSIGRIWRLTTQSTPRYFNLVSPHAVDIWNMGIILEKLENLKAIVGGDIERLGSARDSEMWMDHSMDDDEIAPHEVQENYSRQQDFASGFVDEKTPEPYVEGAEVSEADRMEDAYQRALASMRLPSRNREVVKAFYSDNQKLINYEIKNAFERLTNLMGLHRRMNETKNDYIRRVAGNSETFMAYYRRLVEDVNEAFSTGIQPAYEPEVSDAVAINDLIEEETEDLGGVQPSSEARIGRNNMAPQELITHFPSQRQDPLYSSPAETKEGAKLLARMKSDKKAGMRSISDFLHKTFGLIISRERPGGGAPASHNKWELLTRTRSMSWSANVHEAGHGLLWVIEGKNPAFFKRSGFGRDLKAMAEEDPFVYASAKNYLEGFAEYVRLFIENYDELIAKYPRAKELERALDSVDPEISKTLRDAARAYGAFRQKDLVDMFQSYANDIPKKTIKESWDEFISMGLVNYVTQGHALERMDREFRKAIYENAQSKKEGRRIASEFMKKIRGTQADVFGTYNMTLQVGREAEAAMNTSQIQVTSSGRVWEKFEIELLKQFPDFEKILPSYEELNTGSGNFIKFNNVKPIEIYSKIGSHRWDLFNAYGAMKAAIERGSEYFPGGRQAWPGQMEGITIGEMQAAVARLDQENPDFAEQLTNIRGVFDALQMIKVMGGRKSVSDIINDRKKFQEYWPMQRVIDLINASPGRGGRNRIVFDVGRAQGSQMGVKDVMESLFEQIQMVYGAYYNNKFINALNQIQISARGTEDIPMEASVLLSRVMTRIEKVPKLVATVDPAELAKWIAQAINEMRLTYKGQAVTFPEEPVKATDINIMGPAKQIWRAQVPNKYNVLMWYDINSGTRKFSLVRDPYLFQAMFSTQDSTAFSKFLDKHVVPLTNVWKRSITGRLAFAISNVMRDPMEGVSPDPEAALKSWIPAQNFLAGLFATVADRKNLPLDHDLWARSVEASMGGARLGELNAIQRKLSEGLYVEGWDQLKAWQKMMTALEPYRVVSAIVKPIDMAAYMTGLTGLTEMTEKIPRRGQYWRMKRKGFSDEWAIMGQNTVSGKFGEHPASKNAWAVYRAIGFMNPSLQTTYRSLMALTDPDPRVRAASMIRFGLWGIIGTAAAWAINQLFTPPKLKDREKEIPEEDKINTFRLGGYIRLPFAYGPMGAFQSYTWNKLDELAGMNDPVSREKMATRLLKDMLFNVPGDPLFFMQPAGKTLIENAANKNFFWGTAIERDWMKYYEEEPWKRAYPETPKLYIGLSRLTGLGPLKIQHFIRDGIAIQIDDTAKLIDIVMSNKKVREGSDLPFVGQRLAREPIGFMARSVKEVEELERKYQAINRRYKSMLDSGIKDPNVEVQVTTLRVMHNAFLDVQKINKEIKEESKKPNPDYKTIDNLKREMVRICRLAIENPYYIINTRGEESLPEDLRGRPAPPPEIRKGGRKPSGRSPRQKGLFPSTKVQGPKFF